MEIKKWYDSINNMLVGDPLPKCPFCNSKNTDYRMIQISGDLGTADIWCNKCKKAIHISRIEVPKDRIREVVLPQSLKY